MLAEIAAVRRIFSEAFDGELVHLDDLLADAFLRAVFHRVSHFPFRNGCEIHRDSHGFVAEDFMSFMHKVCGIHAAGKRQHDAAELLQVCFQIVLFLL